ncbi:MAG: dienelactone hydrolase family protein [Candidatus Sumerlaeia bacterium]|nr:dienelactone hydrolase family protein [Candidatus Sumerlaeia bacterium]
MRGALIALSLLLAALIPVAAGAQPVGETVVYKEGETELEGFVVSPAKPGEKLPAVLVVHEWMGLNDFAKEQAARVADLGYVGFAVDIYGKGVRAKDAQEAGQLAGKYRSGDRALLRARINAALEEVRKRPDVDADRIAAIGFCFGGSTVLELARSGADVRGVVSFHGGIAPVDPADAKNIKAKVLVLHGAVDPYDPREEVIAFEDEMNAAGVDYEVVLYSGTVHSFTNPGAGNDPSRGAAYNERSAKRAFARMEDFLAEVFAPKK